MQSPSSGNASDRDRDRDSDSDSETDVEEPSPPAGGAAGASGVGDHASQEITQVCKRRSHWEYRTDRTVGESFKRYKRVPPDLDESWAKWAREHPDTCPPPHPWR